MQSDSPDPLGTEEGDVTTLPVLYTLPSPCRPEQGHLGIITEKEFLCPDWTMVLFDWKAQGQAFKDLTAIECSQDPALLNTTKAPALQT